MARTPLAALPLLFVSLGIAAAQDEPPLPEPAFPSLPASAPAGSGVMQPCMEELEGEVRCGRYRVWVGGYARACEVWPYARLDPSFWEPIASRVPALLFSGSRDPVTPASGAEAVAGHLPNSLHVVVEGAGHFAGGPCVLEIQEHFIDAGTVEGLDTSCLEERAPTDFVLPGE